jgi:hypothetical protein
LVPSCDFYALADDCQAVLDFIFDQDGWVLHELASRPGHKVRTYRSTADVSDAAALGTRDAHFQLEAYSRSSSARGSMAARSRSSIAGAKIAVGDDPQPL